MEKNTIRTKKRKHHIRFPMTGMCWNCACFIPSVPTFHLQSVDLANTMLEKALTIEWFNTSGGQYPSCLSGNNIQPVFWI